MKWQKAVASHASGACVEVAEWMKSSLCSPSACVEVAAYVHKSGEDRVGVRDSKLGEDSPVLLYTKEEWAAFLDGAKKGEFDHFAK